MSLFSPISSTIRLAAVTTINSQARVTPHRFVHIKKYDKSTLNTEYKQDMLNHLKKIAEELDVHANTAAFGPNFVKATHAYVDTLRFIWEIEQDQRPPRYST